MHRQEDLVHFSEEEAARHDLRATEIPIDEALDTAHRLRGVSRAVLRAALPLATADLDPEYESPEETLLHLEGDIRYGHAETINEFAADIMSHGTEAELLAARERARLAQW